MATVSNPTVDASGFQTYECSAASIGIGRIVQLDTTNTTNQKTVVLAAADDEDYPLGVTTTLTSAANTNVTIQMSGVVKIDVDGSGTAISEGDRIVATTGGQGIKASASDGTLAFAIGVALMPSAADGDRIPVHLNRLPLEQ